MGKNDEAISRPPRVLVTGGGSGIGLKTVQSLLADHGAHVAVLTLDVSLELERLKATYTSERLLIIPGDVTADGVNARAVEQTIATFQYLDSLICCVGTLQPVETIRSTSLDKHRQAFEINYFATISVVQACIPHLLERAKGTSVKPTIGITTSGVDHQLCHRGWSAYCNSKAALSRFIQLLAYEEPDIHVLGLYPLLTESPLVDLILGGAYDNVMLPEEIAKFHRMKALGRQKGGLEPAEWPASALVKMATGSALHIPTGQIREWERFDEA